MSIYLGTSPVAASHQSLSSIVDAFYPVGSVFIGTTSTCPLAAIKGTWTLQSSGIVTSVDTNVSVKGNGMAMGITDGTNNAGLFQNTGSYPSLQAVTQAYGRPVGSAGGSTRLSVVNLGVTTDPTKSGIVGTVTHSTLTVNIWKRTA